MNAWTRVVGYVAFGIGFSLSVVAYTQAPIDEPPATSDRAPEASGPIATSANELQDGSKTIGETDSPVVQAIERALSAPLHSSGLDFTEQPLNDVVTALAEEYGIPILLDVPALEANGLREDEPVTINLHGVSLKSGLRHMLKNLQLTYTIADEALVITTRDGEEKHLLLCVYDVRDLVDPNNGRTLDELAKVLQGVIVERHSVRDGDARSIWALKPGTLIVRLSRSQQEEFRELVAAIRDANCESRPNNRQAAAN